MRSLALAILLGLAAALSAGLPTLPVHGQSIGVSPPELVVEDGFRGSEYRETFLVLNEQTVPIEFKLSVEGPSVDRGTPIGGTVSDVGDASEWVTPEDLSSEPIRRIRAAANETVSVVAHIRVPAEAANGTYRANIILEEVIASEVEGSGQDVARSLVTQLRVDVVGDQRLEASIADVVLDPVEVGQPLRVRMALENTGNVELIPEVRLNILDAQGAPVDDVAQAHERVPVGASVSLATEWDTTGRLPGQYRVDVVVLVSGQQAYNREFPFELFPEGTFTRQGEFLSLELTNRPDPGAVASLIANFENTGKIDTLAKFVGRVFRGGELVDTIESTELLVQAGARGELEVFVPVEERGSYSVEGLINFEGHETETRTIEFKVPADLGAGGFPQTWQLIAIGAIVIVIVVAGALEVRRRRRNKPSQAAG